MAPTISFQNPCAQQVIEKQNVFVDTSISLRMAKSSIDNSFYSSVVIHL